MHHDAKEVIEEQEPKGPPTADRKPSGARGFEGPPPWIQDSTPRPTALPVMPRVSVEREPEGWASGKIARANSPARLPKPIQINTMGTQDWASGESSGMAVSIQKILAPLTSRSNLQLGCSILDASRARRRPPAAWARQHAPRCPQRHGHVLAFPRGIRLKLVISRETYRCRFCSCDTDFWAAASLLSGNCEPGGSTARFHSGTKGWAGSGRRCPSGSPSTPSPKSDPRPSKPIRQPLRPVLEAVMGHLRGLCKNAR